MKPVAPCSKLETTLWRHGSLRVAGVL